MPFFFLESENGNAKGLSELVRQSFGFPLDKNEQISDWERRPLRSAQLTYAGVMVISLIIISYIIGPYIKSLFFQ